MSEKPIESDPFKEWLIGTGILGNGKYTESEKSSIRSFGILLFAAQKECSKAIAEIADEMVQVIGTGVLDHKAINWVTVWHNRLRALQSKKEVDSAKTEN